MDTNINTTEQVEARDVPYFVYEGELIRSERYIRRLVIALVVSIALLFISNMAWLVFFNSFDIADITATQTTTDGGDANFIGAGGTINGESDSTD